MTEQPGDEFTQDGVLLQEQQHHTYTTKSGKTFKLRKISSMVFRSLQGDFWGMPQPPVIDVKVGPKQKVQKQANPDDPDYKERLQRWQNNKNERILMYTWVHGIDDELPEADEARLKQFMPGGTPELLKYTWIAEYIDDDEIGLLTEAITGQNMVTEKGISDAETTFPGNGERVERSELSLTESTDQHQL